jgi:hypothetical protein
VPFFLCLSDDIDIQILLPKLVLILGLQLGDHCILLYAVCCMLYAVGFSPQYVASSYVDDYQLPATQYVVRKTYYIVRTTYYINRSPGPGGAVEPGDRTGTKIKTGHNP